MRYYSKRPSFFISSEIFISKLLTKIIQIISVEKSLLVGYLKIINKFGRMKEERVILVDKLDNQIGTMPKMEAHQKAILHRAFSVFILNERGELMLQQRAHDKYHSPSLWTNTCCSHQREEKEMLKLERED